MNGDMQIAWCIDVCFCNPTLNSTMQIYKNWGSRSVIEVMAVHINRCNANLSDQETEHNLYETYGEGGGSLENERYSSNSFFIW